MCAEKYLFWILSGKYRKIPIVVIEWTWWWADKLKNKYLDDRYKNDPNRFICKWVKTPEEALEYLKNLT